MSKNDPESVSFIRVEDDDKDLILSFAIDLGEPGEVASLILLRAPVYEPLLPPEERGVKVSHELHPEMEYELLRRIRLRQRHVEITTHGGQQFFLDVSRVDAEAVNGARKILRRMNFDRSFALDLGI